MLELLRLSIVTFGLIGITIAITFPVGRIFDKIITIGMGLLVVHAAQALFFDGFFPEKSYLETAAPYGLLYGPLLYMAIASEEKGRINRQMVLVHIFPFIFLFLTYLMLCFFSGFRELFLRTFFKIFYGALPVSLLGYAIWGCFKTRSEAINLNRKVLYFSTMILAVLACFFINLKLTKPEEPSYLFPVLIIYSIMLAATTILVFYTILKTKKYYRHPEQSQENPVNIERRSAYRKSAMPAESLQSLEKKINEILVEEKIYLDSSLSLSKMAEKLQVSSHQLSQALTGRFGKNFNQLINAYRIREACELIKEHPDLSLEEIAYKSGFNSRITFTRNFKNEKGCSPSEYRKTQLVESS